MAFSADPRVSRRPLRNFDAGAALDRFQDRERQQHALPRLFVGKRRLALAAQESAPGDHLFGVTFPGEGALRRLAMAMDDEFLEVADLRGEPGPINRALLLGPSGVALRAVDELATG